jgi:hypothetical protein
MPKAKTETLTLEKVFHNMQDYKSLELTLIEIFEKEKESCINYFFNQDLWNEDRKDLLNKFNNLNISLILLRSIGGDEDEYGSEYYKVYEFERNGETLFVKFDGYYSSYEGTTFNGWSFVKPVSKTVISYE